MKRKKESDICTANESTEGLGALRLKIQYTACIFETRPQLKVKEYGIELSV